MTGFFRSRWVEPPEHVREVPGGGLPQGFRAAGVAAGIKQGGGKDVALIVSDAPDTTSAARFTASGVLAAPVVVTKERTRLDALRVIAANSGNANAATGRPGLDEAARIQGAAAIVSGVREDQVAVCSTGVIGVQIDGNAVAKGLLAARPQLRPDGDADAAAAIMTTDAFEKRATLEVGLSGGTVRLAAQAKGAGMISPRYATMLCFVQTDAAVPPETADLLLGVTVKRSFDRISVDGQLSTNDTVVLMCSGASGVAVAPESDDELRFGEALDALLRQLALDIARDGEGARRVGRVVVRGGNDGVGRVARAVADSPLVKTALYGGDPNWGRIAQALGAALPGTHPLAFDIAIEGTLVCSGGFGVRLEDPAALAAAVQRNEVEIAITLPGDGFETEVFFSDLGHEYVTINADYTT